jgi:hypothetical protein
MWIIRAYDSLLRGFRGESLRHGFGWCLEERYAPCIERPGAHAAENLLSVLDLHLMNQPGPRICGIVFHNLPAARLIQRCAGRLALT